MEEDRQKALNELFNRLQQLDYENKQLIAERAKLNEKVEALQHKLTKITAELERLKSGNAEIVEAVQTAIKKEMAAAKKAKR